MLYAPTANSHSFHTSAFGQPSELQHAGAHSNEAAPLPSESLLRGHKTVEIMHNGSLYKLQATKLGKLILTK
jgi:hemin uptake protein HemP